MDKLLASDDAVNAAANEASSLRLNRLLLGLNGYATEIRTIADWWPWFRRVHRRPPPNVTPSTYQRHKNGSVEPQLTTFLEYAAAGNYRVFLVRGDLHFERFVAEHYIEGQLQDMEARSLHAYLDLVRAQAQELLTRYVLDELRALCPSCESFRAIDPPGKL